MNSMAGMVAPGSGVARAGVKSAYQYRWRGGSSGISVSQWHEDKMAWRTCRRRCCRRSTFGRRVMAWRMKTGNRFNIYNIAESQLSSLSNSSCRKIGDVAVKRQPLLLAGRIAQAKSGSSEAKRIMSAMAGGIHLLNEESLARQLSENVNIAQRDQRYRQHIANMAAGIRHRGRSSYSWQAGMEGSGSSFVGGRLALAAANGENGAWRKHRRSLALA